MPSATVPIIYLDHNIFARLTSRMNKGDEELSKILGFINEKGSGIIPFSATHIYEIQNIQQSPDRMKYVNDHLSMIKSLTKNKFIAYSDELDTYTITERDPFEVFETISELPIFESSQDLLLNLIPTDNIKNSRTSLGLDPKVLNNLIPLDAEAYINDKIRELHEQVLKDEKARTIYLHQLGHLEPMTVQRLLQFVINHSTSNGAHYTEHSKTVAYAALLEAFGYQSQSLKKNPRSAFHDHCHYAIAGQVNYFISEDTRLRKKLGPSSDGKTARGNRVMTSEQFVSYVSLRSSH